MFLTLELLRSEWMQKLLAAHLRRLEVREYGRLWERGNPEKLKTKQHLANHSVKGKERQWKYNRTSKAKAKSKRYAELHPDRLQSRQKNYNQSPEGKARYFRYRNSPKGEEHLKRRNERRRKGRPARVIRPKGPRKKTQADLDYMKAWRARNRIKLRQYWSDVQKLKYATNPQFRLMKNYRSRTAKAFKARGAKMSASTSKLMGCTWSELRAHIESKFQPWMTWENYGYDTWHVDHIRPIARFDLTDPKQVAECFNFKNLQPLPGPENIRKSDKYEELIPA